MNAHLDELKIQCLAIWRAALRRSRQNSAFTWWVIAKRSGGVAQGRNLISQQMPLRARGCSFGAEKVVPLDNDSAEKAFNEPENEVRL
ncbi:MAG: hypothetical protein NZ739_08060 [Verrucomicrobiae bacterium]|nr:hypothetical protein [Verrucomicrobiae bacterium]